MEPNVWQSLLSETFEGGFPGSRWVLYGSPTWDDTSYSAHSGSWSGWCAASTRSPASGYANNMNAWMVHGPFSLADATSARVNFCFKNYSQTNSDFFSWMASIDGNYFYGWKISGLQSDWVSNSFDLSNVYTIGNLCGQSQVWIAFLFTSDSAISGPTYTGAFVDDILLEKDVVPLVPIIRIDPLTLVFSNSTPSLAVMTGSAKLTNATAAFGGLPLEQKVIELDSFWKAFQAGANRVKVIVNLVPPQEVLRFPSWDSPQALQALHGVIRKVQDQVLNSLAPAEYTLRYRFENQAGFSAEVTQAAFLQLASNPAVQSLEPVRQLEPHLAQGLPLMNGLMYRSTCNGAGLAIAICDSGIDYTHPRLGGGGFPNSKVLGGYDFGDNDADPFPNTQAHGTCCAGIAAGDLGTVGDYIGGVAYNAKLYALKMSAGSGGSATTDAMIASWDWCVTHKNDRPEYPILVISTSYGGGRFSSLCDSEAPSMATAANNAVAAGITVLASSGNDGYCDSIAWPSCISNVIAVGAVYDANFGTHQPCVNADSCAPKIATTGCSTGYYANDQTAPDRVPSYSNASLLVGLLAPANSAYTTDIVGVEGYSTGDYDASFGGTSAACPYAAGAVACLQSAAKSLLGRYLTPAEVKARLLASGDNVTDTKVAITKPRVNLGHAIETLPGFSIYNDGGVTLSVTSMVLEASAPWVSWAPAAPFDIAVGGARRINVNVDFNLAPLGESTRRLLVYSSDATKNPYPGGVNVIVNNAGILQPRITDFSMLGTTSAVVRFTTVPNRLYFVQQRTNVEAGLWSVVVTNLLSSGVTAEVTDTNVAGAERRFYRVGLQP